MLWMTPCLTILHKDSEFSRRTVVETHLSEPNHKHLAITVLLWHKLSPINSLTKYNCVVHLSVIDISIDLYIAQPDLQQRQQWRDLIKIATSSSLWLVLWSLTSWYFAFRQMACGPKKKTQSMVCHTLRPEAHNSHYYLSSYWEMIQSEASAFPLWPDWYRLLPLRLSGGSTLGRGQTKDSSRRPTW